MFISTDGKDNSFEIMVGPDGKMRVRSCGYGSHSNKFRFITKKFLQRYLAKRSKGVSAYSYNEKKGRLKWKF